LCLKLLEVGTQRDALLDECTYITTSLGLGRSLGFVLGLRNRLNLRGFSHLVLLRGRGIHSHMAIILVYQALMP
jgi:hypothetical protein